MMDKYFANLHKKTFASLLIGLMLSSFSVFAAPPTNTVPGTISASKNKALRITNGLSVDDTDLENLTVTLTVTNGGQLFLGTTVGLTVNDGDGTDGSVEIFGSLADLNNAMADLTFINETTAASSIFLIQSNDGGGDVNNNFTINLNNDNSLAFAGDDDVMSIPNGGAFFTGGTFTYEAWVLIVDDSSPQWGIFEFSGATTNVIYINSSGQVIAEDTNGGLGGRLASDVGTFPIDGNWHHLAIVDDGTNPEVIYVDGTVVGIALDNFTNFNTSAGTSNILVGDRASIAGYEFSGQIDELRVWSVGRSASDVANNKDNSLVGNEPGLEAYYRLDQGTAGGSNAGVNNATNNDDSGGTFNAGLTGFTLSGTTSNWVYGQNFFSAVNTDPATDILSLSATLGGTITDQGGDVITERGVVYAVTSTNDLPVIGGTGVTKEPEGSVGTGTFSENISGLTLSTNYTFRAYSMNVAGTSYGNTQTFTTQSFTAPIISTSTPASGRTSVSAIVAGNISSDGGQPITERGVVYSVTTLDADPLIGDPDAVQVIDPMTTTGNYTKKLEGLTPGETYSYKAYATNSQGTSYGNAEQFVLADSPTFLPGDLAFTMTNGDAASAFAVVALKTIPSGTVIHFTDKGYDVDISDFFTAEGIVSFTAGTTIFTGDQILIDPNGAGTATLKSGGSAGSIIEHGTFLIEPDGDNILAFQGLVNGNTDYAIGGFISGLLTRFSNSNMDGNSWTLVAGDTQESELPTSLTNADNALSLFPAGLSTSPFHRYNYSTVTGLAHEVRLEINNLANWNRNQASAANMGTLGTFNINSPPIVTVPGDQIIDDVTTVVFSGAELVSVADNDGHDQTVVVTATNNGNFSNSTGIISVTGSGAAIVTTNNTSNVTISGTLADVNATLDGMQYVPGGIAGQHQITVSSDDGNTGTDSKIILVNVSGTFDVGTNTADTGLGSFREALNDANLSGVTADVIEFTGMTGGVITLASDLPSIAGTVTINGPGARDLTIDGVVVHKLIRSSSPGVDLEINDLTLTGGSNITTNNRGGAISVDGVHSLKATGLHITNNQAYTDGGGIYLNATGSSSISGCLIENNFLASATPDDRKGGGIYLDSDCNISNTTIYNNTAVEGGGVYANFGIHAFKHVSIASNQVYLNLIGAGTDVTLEYSIIEDLTINPGSGQVSAANVASHIFSTSGGTVSNAPNVTSGSVDAILGAIVNQGGNTNVLQISGINLVNAAIGSAEGFDQIGNARPNGADVDLGAYERDPVSPKFEVTWLDNNPADGVVDRAQLDFDVNVIFKDANAGAANFDAFSLSGGAFNTAETDFGTATYKNINTFTVDVTGLGSGTGPADFPSITYNDSGEISVVSFDTGDQMVNASTPTATNDAALPIITGISLDPNNTFVDVTFSEPVFTDLASSALLASDFTLSVTGGMAGLTNTTPTGITDLGSNVYQLTFDLDQPASGTETLTVNLFDGMAVYDAAGNPASGTQTNNTVTLNDKLLPFITKTVVAADNSNIEVTFNEPVFNTTGGSGALETTDFTISVSGGVAGFSGAPDAITPLGGNTYQLDFALSPPLADGNEVLTVNPADGSSIFDAADNNALATQSNNTVTLNDKLPPSITNTTVAPDNTFIEVTFSEPVFTDLASGPLEASDFILSVTGGVADVVSPTPTGIFPQPGNAYQLTFSLDALPNGAETITVNPVDGAAIFDGADNPAAASQSNNEVALNDQAPPFITGVALNPNNTFVDVSFSEAVFNTTGGSGALEEVDFVLSISGGVASLVSSIPTGITDQGSNVYRLTFDLDQAASGTETLTVNLIDGASVFDGADNAASATQANNSILLNDKLLPFITKTTVAPDNSNIEVTFNEPVFTDAPGNPLVASDFNLSVIGGVASVSGAPDAITPLVGNTYRLDFTLTPPLADGTEILTVNPADGSSIFDAADNPAADSQTNNTVALNDKLPPTIINTDVAPDNSYIDVTFSEPVFTATGAALALVPADFTLSVSGGVAGLTSTVPTSIAQQVGETYRLFFNLDQLANGDETLTVNPANGAAIFDASDNAAAASQGNNTVGLNDQVLPYITVVALAGDNSYIDVSFNEAVFTTGGGGALIEADFTLSVSGGSATLLSSTPDNITDQGSNIYRLEFTLIGGLPDGSDMITVNPADAASIFDAASNAALATQSNNTATLNDQDPPTINTSTFDAASNKQLSITVNVDEIATLYYAIYTTQQSGGSPAAADIKNAANSPDFNGSFSVPTANVDVTGFAVESFIDNQQYYTYIVAEDGSGNLSVVIEDVRTMFDTDPPIINPAPPLDLGPDTETEIKFTVNLDENATIYYLVREINTPPSKGDILSGTADPGDIAGTFGYITPGSNDEEVISTLTQNTTYYVHWYAEDVSVTLNQTAIQDEGSIMTTEDVIAPAFDGITGISGITATSLDVDADLDAAGTAFYVVLLDGAPVPLVQDVIDGLDGNGDVPVAKGSIVVGDPSTPESETVEFLQSSTIYDIYLVAQDGNGNKSPVRTEANKTTLVAAVQSGGNVRVTKPTPLILCLGEDFTTMGRIKIQEDASNEGGFPNSSLKTLVLTLPDELEFNTSASIAISDDGGNDDFSPEINTTVPVLTAKSITLSYDTDNDNDRDEINIDGLEVKAVSAFSGTKSLLRIASNGGTATIDGIVAGDGTSFADFSVASASVPPAELTVTYCTGDVVDIADFTTNDAAYAWYTDFNLTNLQYTGEVTLPESQLGFDVNVAGTTTLYVTNTGAGECESPAVQVDIVVNPSPVADAGFATQTVCAGEELFVGGFPSLETPTVGGKYIYQWRSEAALRAVDENFNVGLGSFTGTGATSSGAALAFDKSDNAITIAAGAGNEIISPNFDLRSSNAVLFFYGRAETDAEAVVEVYGSDDDFVSSNILLGTASTTSVDYGHTDYRQYAIEIPADDSGLSTPRFSFKVQYLSGVSFVVDEIVLDMGMTNATEAVRSNPFFFPPSNNAGGGDLIFDVVLTIHDPNYCSSEVNGLPSSNLTVHDKIEAAITVRNQDLLEIGGSVDVSSDELILDINPAAVQAPPDPLVEFTGTGILYDNVDDGAGMTGTVDNGFGFYEFFPSSAGEGTHGITYIATDEDGCEESVFTSITVVSSSDFDDLVADQCRNIAPYNIYVSADLIAEIDDFDSAPNPSGTEVDYEFDHIRFADNATVLVAGNDGGSSLDYTYDPEFQFLKGGESGQLFIYIKRTTTDNSIPPPNTSVVTGLYKTTPARVYDIPTITFENLPSEACDNDAQLQLTVQLTNTNTASISTGDDQGTYEIKVQGAGDGTYVNLGTGGNGLLDFSDPMGAGSGAGNYTIRYTSHEENDPNPNFGTGCSSVITQDIVIYGQPAAPTELNQRHFNTLPSLNDNLVQDGPNSFHYVYCENDFMGIIYAPFTDGGDALPFQQDPGNQLYFRWYEDDGSGNTPGDEIIFNTFSGQDDNRVVRQQDLFNNNDPLPSGESTFYLTLAENRNSLLGGEIFDGCESDPARIFIEVLPTPVIHPVDVTVSTSFEQQGTDDHFIAEYCFGDTVEDIVIEDDDPGNPLPTTTEITWFAEDGVTVLYRDTDGDLTVSMTDLGFASAVLPAGTTTLYYSRRDGVGHISDAGSGGQDFVGCPGEQTELNIVVHEIPGPPVEDSFFDANNFACVGDIDDSPGGDEILVPGDDNEVTYIWYDGPDPLTDTPFSFDDTELADFKLNLGFDANTPGVTTAFLSQIRFSDFKGASLTSGFAGCESTSTKQVDIEIFPIPDAPTVTANDGVVPTPEVVANDRTDLAGAVDIKLIVCSGEITVDHAFDTETTYDFTNGQQYDWYESTVSGTVDAFIGTFTDPTFQNISVAAPNITINPNVTSLRTHYFAVLQTTDIVSGEHTGCESDPIIVALEINPIPNAPTATQSTYNFCQVDDVENAVFNLNDAADGTVYHWYTSLDDVGIAGNIQHTGASATGSQLGLSNDVSGEFTLYATQRKSINTDVGGGEPFLGCESTTTLKVTINVQATQLGPVLASGSSTAADRTICQLEDFNVVTVESDLGAGNGDFKWYYLDDDGITITQIAGATNPDYQPTGSHFAGQNFVNASNKFISSFTLYASQVTGAANCESNLRPITMTVQPIPTAPVSTQDANSDTYEICQFDALVAMEIAATDITTGDIFTWYSDAGLSTQIFTGTSYTPTGNAIPSGNVNASVASSKSFYVTRTTNSGVPAGFSGCEGPSKEITYVVNALPVLEVRKSNDTAIPTQVCVDDGTINLVGGLDAAGLPTPPDDVTTLGEWTGLGITDGTNGAAVFDPVVAVGDSEFLDQSEAVLLTFTYTDAKGCENTINHTITVRGLPSVSITLGREGAGGGQNEFCIDDSELTLFGNPIGASGTFTNAINNTAIDNTVGNSQAEIDLTDAFETVNPGRNLRQVDYVVTFTFTDANGCQNSTDITIKINNIPEPDFTISRAADPLSSGTGGVDVEVCIDDLSTSTNLNLTERIVLQDATDVSMGTLTTGVFSGNASGVPLSAAALAKNSEGEYYFYPSQAVADAVAGNPVAFSNVTSIDFTIDYTFTNDLTCSGSASAFGKTKKIRVYRLPQPVIKIDDGAALDENDYCIDHDVSGDPVRLFVQSIGFDTGDGFGGTFVSDPPLSNAALYNAGVSGGRDEIFFDPAVAYAESGLNSANEEVATFSITYEYATSDIGCTATSGAVTLVVNPLPVFDFTYRQAGAVADNEVCVDEGTLTVVSSDPESGGAIATFSLVGVPQTAIDDNNDGTADIDIEQLFKDASATTGFTERQISVDVNLQYQDAKGCANNVVQTIVIHNLPVPEMDVARNDASASLVTGTRDGSGNLLVELCIDDLSTSEAGATDKILISDITDQASQGTFVSASFSELSFGLNGANDGLENNGDGTAFFYPAAAMARADNNPAFRTDTFIDFVIDMSYENDNGCSGKALAQSSANGVQDIDNTVTIRVYRSPNPTIKINNNGNIVSSAAVCIVDGNTNANEVTIFREGIQFNQNGVLGGAGSYTLDPALSSAAFSAPTGINDEAILNSQLAYNEFGNGSDPLVVTITYTYSTDKSCGQTSNAVTVTINPLPTVDFVIPEGPVAANVNEFCIDNANISLNASAFEGTGSVSAGGSGLFSTQFGASGLTTVNGFQAQFNFESAYETAQGDGSEPIQNVTYTFTDNRGCIGRVTKQITINTKPVVQIDTEGGCDDAAVEFQFSTVPNDPNNPQTTDPGNPITSVTWDFDDKEATDEDNTSNEFSPSHAYVEAGNYSPTLFVENDRGCVSTVVTRDIVVGEIPDVNFTVQGLCFTDEIVYTASPQSLTFGTIDSLLFDYGDMNIDSIKVVSQQDFVFPHTYQEPGTYDVALSLITNNKCNRVITRSVTILPVETAPYFNDFEVLNESDTVKVKFYKQEEVNGIRKNVEPEQSELEVVSMDGWYVDLRPIEDKEDPEGDWGKLPSEFNSWQYGIPSGALVAAPGANNHAWATNLDGNYINNESRSWVYSPCFDFTSLTRPMVSFDQIFHFSDQRDGVVLQYSIDGGSEWVALGDYEPFTDDATGTEWFTNENITGKPGQQELQASNEGDIGWAGNLGANTAQWVSARHKLDGILPADRSSVIFRFALGSDGSAASEGFAFDNFAIKDREKNVLLEQFSSTNVTASATVDASINAIIDDPTLNNGDIIRVNYHTTFKGDLDNLDTSVTPAVLTNPDPVSILNIEDPSARAVFYGISAAPTSLINGEVNRGATARTEVPWTLNNLARRSLDDALFNIVVNPNFGSDPEVLDVSVNITAAQDIGDDGDAATALPQKEIIVYIAVVEKTVVMSNAANGQLETRAALRKMLPNGIGTREPRRQYPIGTSVSVNESWEIQKGLDGPDLAVVVFVQDIETKNVYQTVSVDVVGKVSPTITGIDDGFDGRDYSLYPNPASKEVFVLFDQMTTELMNWTVYDQTGKIYKYGKLKPGAEGFGLDTREFPSGMYFISINGENLQFRNKKLMIAH